MMQTIEKDFQKVIVFDIFDLTLRFLKFELFV